MTMAETLNAVLALKDNGDVGEGLELAQHLARWVALRGAGDAVALAVFAAALAEARGDACAELDRMGGSPVGKDAPEWPEWAAWQAALRSSEWVGPEHEAAVLALEADGACYLRRVWHAECELAAAVRARCMHDALTVPAASGAARPLPQWLAEAGADQQRAAAMAECPSLLLLTGPPGSGKTYTLLRALLLRRRAAGRPLRMLLAAPTGKAAQRIEASLRAGKSALRAASEDTELHAWLDEIPDEARTLHRLLGYRPQQRRFLHDAGNPLAADVVAVDEASMVDLELMRRLFAAMPAAGLLLLAGDPDQLASVAAGSVLSDLVRASERPTQIAGRLTPATQVRPLMARLDFSRRSGAERVALFESVRAGDATTALALLHAGGHFTQVANIAALDRELQREIAPTDAVGRFDELLATDDPALALAQLASWQCLCALRHGAFGSVGVGTRIEQMLRARSRRTARGGLFHGQALLIESNDYARGLFNGDIGVVLIEAGGRARIWFAGADRRILHSDAAGTASASMRAFAPGDLPPHASAFALTVHKAQGAEFDHVTLVLPPRDVRVLGRELVYTALTRSRTGIRVLGTNPVFAAALARPLARRGRLCERIVGEIPAGVEVARS